MKKFDKIFKLKGSAQKAAYKLLNADEKHLIWQIRLKNYLKENDLNVVQTKLINELLNALTLELFQIENLKLREEFKKEFDEFKTRWLPKAKKEFTDHQIRELVFQLNSTPQKGS